MGVRVWERGMRSEGVGREGLACEMRVVDMLSGVKCYRASEHHVGVTDRTEFKV